MSNVDGPDGNANDGNDFRQLLAEFVQLLLQGSLDFLSFRHLSADVTDGRVQASANDDTAGLASSNVGAREQNVFLVLVDGTGVGHGFIVLDNGHGFTSQDRLVNADGGRQDLHDTDVSGDLVTNCSRENGNKSSINCKHSNDGSREFE